MSRCPTCSPFPKTSCKENDARGWLLLEHLRQWREWSRTPGNPFERRVDLDRVGLVGHSRGGEAVAVAGVFNRLSFYPDDARVAFDYVFGIRGIAAIAPVDGEYKPAGGSLGNYTYGDVQRAIWELIDDAPYSTSKHQSVEPDARQSEQSSCVRQW